jgi:hypothetical protein
MPNGNRIGEHPRLSFVPKNRDPLSIVNCQLSIVHYSFTMSLITIIKEAVEDLTSLQIATLHGSGITLNSGIDATAKAELEKKIAEQQTALNAARNQWLAATDLTDRWDKHRVYRAAKSRLNELQEELHGISPTDIFAKIQLAMGQAKTAGYTRLQINGDSTNFFDSALTEDQAFLTEAHKANVQAAVDVRQKLIDTAKDLLKIGEQV